MNTFAAEIMLKNQICAIFDHFPEINFQNFHKNSRNEAHRDRVNDRCDRREDRHDDHKKVNHRRH